MDNDISENKKSDQQRPIVTLAEFLSVNFENPILKLESLSFHDFQTEYQTAIKVARENNEVLKINAFGILESVCSFHLQAGNQADPYGPMWRMEGRRSAIPSDFRGQQSDVFAELAKVTKNLLLRVRLAETAWLNNKKQSDAAFIAISGLTDIAKAQIEQEHKAETPKNLDYLFASQSLGRALAIARSVGWTKPESIAAKDLLQQLRKQAVETRAPFAFERMAHLDLKYAVSGPEVIASEAEELATEGKDHQVELLEIAAQGFDAANLEDKKEGCFLKIAENYADEAERAPSAMIATHSYMKAIDMLRRVKKTKARRDELQGKLVTRQKDIYEEMGRISAPLDLKEPIQKVEELFSQISFCDGLFQFASLDQSPDPETLKREAQESMEAHPLSSMFAGSVLDSDGKVLLKQDGASPFEFDEETLKFNISKHEAMRRHVTVAAYIGPARRILFSKFLLTEFDFIPLVQASPFVPLGYETIFARGFSHFFANNMVEASNLLIPQLENSLRYVLSQAGLDTSTMRSEMTQENITFSAILGRLRADVEKIFGENLLYEIEMIFDYAGGPMIRHNMAHGLFPAGAFWGVEMIYACWLIFRLVCMPLYPHREAVQKYYSYQD